MKFTWTLASLPLAFASFFWIAGALLDPHYRIADSLQLEATSESIWERLSNVEDYPRWRSDLIKVSVSSVDPSINPSLNWIEIDSTGAAISFSNAASDSLRKWICRYKYGNRSPLFSRVVLVVPIENGETQVAVTEDGRIANPIDRFRYRFISGYSESLTRFLVDLRKGLGE